MVGDTYIVYRDGISRIVNTHWDNLEIWEKNEWLYNSLAHFYSEVDARKFYLTVLEQKLEDIQGEIISEKKQIEMAFISERNSA